MNFSSLQNASERIKAAKIALGVDRQNTWEYLYKAIDNYGRSIVGGLSSPKYRDHAIEQVTTKREMQKAEKGYLNLLLEHMDFSADRWVKMVHLSEKMPKEEREEVFEALLHELGQMTVEEVMQIKNEIRKFIYRHRFYASSEWALPEDELVEYEEILPKIGINIPERS